jgi:Zn-dependent protease with chaperone function
VLGRGEGRFLGQSVEFTDVAGRSVRQPSSVRRWVNPLLALVYVVWACAAAIQGQLVLGTLAGLVWLELAVAVFRLAPNLGGPVAAPAAQARVTPMLEGLCRRAGCATPQLVIRNDVVRCAAVRGRRHGPPVLVLSQPFIEGVLDPELQAMLAHEVIHIVRGDLTAGRRRAWLAILVGVACAFASIAAAHKGPVDVPIWGAAAVVGTLAGVAALSPTNRRRETRADTEGALLAGDPAALAQALAVASQLSDQLRAKLYGTAPWRWVLAPMSWRLPTHPQMAQRISRLHAASATAPFGPSEPSGTPKRS